MESVKIENDYLSVGVNSKGAELQSLVDKRDGVEHMWKADPKFWPRHAPILFPCVGESKGGVITVNSDEYPMGRHGFARHEEFTITNQSTTGVELELKSSNKTLVHFPFEFTFRVRYTVEDAKLNQSFEVVNTDNKEISFQLGGHPAFAVPFTPTEKYDDYEIRFDMEQKLDRHLLTNKGLYSGETRAFLKNTDHFGLYYDLFQEDALVFKNIPSKHVWIQPKNGGKQLHVEYNEFPHLGIWSIPGADYVCIEPWIGCADMANQPTDFEGKDSLISLRSNGQFKTSFTISLRE